MLGLYILLWAIVETCMASMHNGVTNMSFDDFYALCARLDIYRAEKQRVFKIVLNAIDEPFVAEARQCAHEWATVSTEQQIRDMIAQSRYASTITLPYMPDDIANPEYVPF